MSAGTNGDYRSQAIAEWRPFHPECDDLPDEAVARLSQVQAIALRLAVKALGKAAMDSFHLRELSRWLSRRGGNDA